MTRTSHGAGRGKPRLQPGDIECRKCGRSLNYSDNDPERVQTRRWGEARHSSAATVGWLVGLQARARTNKYINLPGVPDDGAIKRQVRLSSKKARSAVGGGGDGDERGQRCRCAAGSRFDILAQTERQTFISWGWRTAPLIYSYRARARER